MKMLGVFGEGTVVASGQTFHARMMKTLPNGRRLTVFAEHDPERPEWWTGGWPEDWPDDVPFFPFDGELVVVA